MTRRVGDEQSKEHRQRWLRGAARGIFALWVPVALLCVTSLAVAHQLSFSRPALDNPALARALSAQRAAAPGASWLLTHVLYSACSCSRRVLEHLGARGVLPGSAERVVLAGRPDAESVSRLRARGFQVDVIAPEALKARYGVEAAPLLIISTAAGDVRYLGGYTERKQGPAIRDRELLGELRAGRLGAPLPLLGCAVSRRLQQLADPWGLKYSRETD